MICHRLLQHSDKPSTEVITMEIISRSQAKELGLARYFTGKPCKLSHIEERYTSVALCVKCVSDRNSRNYTENKDKILIQIKKYANNNRQKISEYQKEYTKNKLKADPKYRSKLSASVRKSRQKHSLKNKSVTNQRVRKKYRENIEFRLSSVARQWIHRYKKQSGTKKDFSTIPSLGYSINQLVARIESTFSEGMQWGNYGEWHIDHIKPVSEFVKEGVADIDKINSLDNLQAMWAQDNWAKGNSWDS